MSKPMIFVSSVISGMEDTRSLVNSMISKDIGYDVVVSEYEGSKAKTPIKKCREWARDCDIYIGILGEKYGSVVPRLGISITELEFNEARRDNPEKILVYVSQGQKEPRQKEFVGRVEDFTKGYFRGKRFASDIGLSNSIKQDLAIFVKERLDFIRARNIRIKPSPTPSSAEYVTAAVNERIQWMGRDVIEATKSLGFSPVALAPKELYLFTCKKRIKNSTILFSIWFLSSYISRDTMRSYNIFFQSHISGMREYNKYPNRFTIFLVHGNATLRTIEYQTTFSSRTCFKVKPGIYLGAGLDIKPSGKSITFGENMLFLSQVRNKETMTSKLVDALEWIDEEFDRIDFRCNYSEPLRPTRKG